MIVDDDCVTRVGEDTSCVRSKRWIRLIHLVFKLTCGMISMLKSPIRINSNPVVCAIESSSSNKLIKSEHALGGRYTLQMRNGLEFGKVISVYKVSILEISMSCLRLMLSDSLK